MKFTDGYWRKRDGYAVLHPAQLHDTDADGTSLTAYATVKPVATRSDTLNAPIITIKARGADAGRHPGHRSRTSSAACPESPNFAHRPSEPGDVSGRAAELTSGRLTARFNTSDNWGLEFVAEGRRLTGSGWKGMGIVDTADGEHYVHEQLDLGVGEAVYGLGERFGPFVKNGQSIDIWNEDGGTSSEQAYKNVPFYLTNRGYGVLVDHPGRVSFEVASEMVTRDPVQRARPDPVLPGHLRSDAGRGAAQVHRADRPAGAAPGLVLRPLADHVVHHPVRRGDGQQVRRRDGRARPAAERVPLRHVLDARVPLVRLRVGPADLPRPAGHAQTAVRPRACASASGSTRTSPSARPCSPRAWTSGFLVRKADGDVWQWDRWQAGMALVDFTNPAARDWYAGKLRTLARDGRGRFKSDFGERIPTDVVWHDGSDPERMHNYYTQLYNQTVFDVLREVRGEGEAVLFARSATVGGQQFPVHWGGDNSATFESMAEIAARRPVAGVVRLRLLEPRHRRLRGVARPGRLQAVGGVRAAQLAQPAARQRLVPGAVAVRRRGGRRPAALHPPQVPAHAVPVRGGPAGAHRGPAGDAADGRRSSRTTRP